MADPTKYESLHKKISDSIAKLERQASKFEQQNLLKKQKEEAIALKKNNLETQKREAEKERLVKQNEDYKNRAKRNEKEVRKIGDTVKRKIITTMHCPYCTRLMNDGGHVDHIYPISKGGHSVETNMVKVCGDCNLKKGSLTLREFIAKYKLDRDDIERRLDELGKKF